MIQRRGRASLLLPEGIQLMRPDGTLYDLVGSVNRVSAQDHFYIGIMEPNRILRSFFFRRTMVKVREDGPVNFEIVPLTMQEFLNYPFNRNLSPPNEAVRYVAEIRNQQTDRERG